MTNELEKQFFSTFGIEPHYYCDDEYVFEAMLEYECTEGNREKCKTCKKVGKSYPQISDRILLELICLCPDLDDVLFNDVEELKETLLKVYISIYEHYATTEWLLDLADELKKRVRTLFEEG